MQTPKRSDDENDEDELVQNEQEENAEEEEEEENEVDTSSTTSSTTSEEEEEKIEEMEMELEAVKETELTLGEELQLARAKCRKLQTEMALLQQHIKNPDLKTENPEHLKELEVVLKKKLDDAQAEKADIKMRIEKVDRERKGLREELEDDILEKADHAKRKAEHVEFFMSKALDKSFLKSFVKCKYDQYTKVRNSSTMTEDEKAAQYYEITGSPVYEEDKKTANARIAYHFYVVQYKLALLLSKPEDKILEQLREIMIPLRNHIWKESTVQLAPLPMSLSDCCNESVGNVKTEETATTTKKEEAKKEESRKEEMKKEGGETIIEPKAVECNLSDLEGKRVYLLAKLNRAKTKKEREHIDSKIRKVEDAIKIQQQQRKNNGGGGSGLDEEGPERKSMKVLNGVSLSEFGKQISKESKPMDALIRVGTYVLAEKKSGNTDQPSKFEVGRVTGIDENSGVVMIKTEGDRDVAVVYPQFDVLYPIGGSRGYYGFDSKEHHDRFKKYHYDAYKFVSSPKHHKYHHKK